MGFSPINNYNSGNNLKSGSTLSQSFNDGTEELLRNVLGSSLYDCKSQDDDSLILSPGEVNDDLNSVYIQAQHKINRWAVINGSKTNKEYGQLMFYISIFMLMFGELF